MYLRSGMGSALIASGVASLSGPIASVSFLRDFATARPWSTSRCKSRIGRNQVTRDRVTLAELSCSKLPLRRRNGGCKNGDGCERCETDHGKKRRIFSAAINYSPRCDDGWRYDTNDLREK